jgi:hypothetical protein
MDVADVRVNFLARPYKYGGKSDQRGIPVYFFM